MSKTGSKYKIVFIDLKNIFLKMYNTVIYRIYAFLYNIKLCTKFTKAFDCKLSKI